ncbi:MAG: hypothetical protein JW863_10225 [Chitinispirillaceae bacterium]|nr:hypothetical protein [Chitinispirillaceae bacterium]
MEFVVIPLLLIVVIILQIVILGNQQKNTKLLKSLSTFKPRNQHPDHGRERNRDRKDNNFKHNRRNQQDFKPKQSSSSGQQTAQASGAVENVEKSLRDINLKLKNAERDQEAARRRIQENIGEEGSGPRQRQRNDGNRGGRDNNRRDRNNRNNWRGRNNQDRPSNSGKSHSPADHHPSEGNTFQESQQASTVSEPATLPDLTPVDFDAELEHGRKVQVKRRILKEELPGAAQENPAETGTSQNSDAVDFSVAESTEQTESSTDEIRFGRR